MRAQQMMEMVLPIYYLVIINEVYLVQGEHLLRRPRRSLADHAGEAKRYPLLSMESVPPRRGNRILRTPPEQVRTGLRPISRDTLARDLAEESRYAFIVEDDILFANDWREKLEA